MLKRRLLWITLLLLTPPAVFAGLLAFPAPLFTHTLSSSMLELASDRPIPVQGGMRLIESCQRLLLRSPLPLAAPPYRIYVPNEDWRTRIFFAISPQAGGLAFHVVGRHVLLSGANFESGQLLKSGRAIEPPRTLAYFCAHEVTHIVVAERIGTVASLRLPEWIREGVADYVAIEDRQPFDELRRSLGDRRVDFDMMNKFGVYPRYRLLVTYFLEVEGWSIDQLLKSQLTFDEAMRLMRNGKG